MDIINIGLTADDHTGDPLRTAFDKCNDNFAELLSVITDTPIEGVTINFDDMVQILASMPDTTANYASLAAAVAAIGITPKTLWIPSDQTVSDDLVIPATLQIVPLNGAKITIASGKTLTGLKEAYPEWFSNGLMGAINSGAKKIFLKPGGSYAITGTVGSALATISGYQGFELVGPGATITDDQTYTGTQTATFLSFVGSNNIYIDPSIKFVSQASNNVDQRGMTWFKFTEGCNGISGGAEIVGGLHGFYFQQGSPMLPANVSKNIDLDIRATTVYYPYLAERSGENAKVRIDGDGNGRDFFIFGGGNNTTADIKSKNQTGATMVSSASGGEGGSNITVNFTDTASDQTASADSWHTGLQFYNETPATFRNIKFNLHIINPATLTNKDSFRITKYNNVGGADSTGRGHILDSFELTGYSSQVDTSDHVAMIGAFASTDKIRNFRIKDFYGAGVTEGGSRIVLNGLGNALQDIAKIDDVYLPVGVISLVHTTGSAVFSRCTALDLTDSTSDTSPQDYISCNITNGDIQSRLNKKLVNTRIGSIDYSVPNGYSKNTGSIADNAEYDLTLNGNVNQQGFLFVTRGGGNTAVFNLGGGNHTVQEALDPNNGFSVTKDTAGFNVYWAADKYVLQNKSGYAETYGVDLTYFTRMD